MEEGQFIYLNLRKPKKCCYFNAFFEQLRSMKKLYICLILSLVMGFTTFAQQEAQFTHNMFNNMFYNPAFAGSSEAICFTGIARQQWMGIKEDGNNVSPRTMLISLDAPVNLLHGGLGGTVYQDQLGYYKSIGVRLEYAYRFNLGSGILSLGAQVGMLNSTYDFSKFKPIEDGDVVLSDKTKQNNFITDFGFGTFYKMPGKFYLGISAVQLSEAKSPIGKADLQLKRHYYLAGGYEYTLSNYSEFEQSQAHDPRVAPKCAVAYRLCYSCNFFLRLC